MSFHDDITEILTRFAMACYTDLGSRTPSSRRDTILRLNYRQGGGHQPFYVSSPFFRAQLNNSGHERLAQAAFVNARKSDTIELIAGIKRHVPALAQPNLSMEIDLKSASRSGKPRLQMSLSGTRITSGPVLIPTLARKLDATRAYLDSVPRDASRHFRICDNKIAARDAYDALRIYTALYHPGLIENPPASTPDWDVVEILDHKPLFQALFAAPEPQDAYS